MKVLNIVCFPFETGGVEAFIINVMKTIDLSGLQIDFFTLFGFENERYKKIIEERKSKIYIADYNKGKIKAIKQLIDVLGNNNYDVVHIHSSNIKFLMLFSLLSKAKRIRKIITHVHSAGRLTFLHYVAKAVSVFVLPLCVDVFCACSLDAGIRKYPKFITPEKITIIKNGIDVSAFKFDKTKRSEVRSKLNYNSDDYVIGHVGRFAAEKNHNFIIDVFSELRKADNRYKLLLVGDGELRESVQSEVKNLGLTDSVVFTGNVSNVQDYMQAMDLFVLPSAYEGLPLTGVEAQACGLPCIFSTGVPEEVKLTEKVEFVPLADKKKWIETIDKMVYLPKSDNTEIIREAGYDIKETAGKLKEIYFSR